MESFSVYADKFSVYTERFSICTEKFSIEFYSHRCYFQFGDTNSSRTSSQGFYLDKPYRIKKVSCLFTAIE